jgi:type IV pilus assembly protein PilQ
MKFGFLDSSLGAFVEALETVGDTSVVASPRLLCLNKHRAEILIGQQLGYISTTVTETSTAQNVEFLEVGTQLRLRPFIAPDGMIRMEVHPELSTGSVELKGEFTLPEKEVTQVTTNIMVPDGCTMIIGGLMREDLDKRSGQIPFLGDIPGLGILFRSKSETHRRSEILVLITPRIVNDELESWEGQKAASDFHRRHNELAEQMNPMGRRYMARKYYRMAKDAWANGECDLAREYIDLSIRFDPISREAAELRSEMQGKNISVPSNAAATAALHPVDGEEIAPWIIEELQQGPNPPSEVPQQPLPSPSATRANPPEAMRLRS